MVRIGVTTYYEKTGENFAALIPYDYIQAITEQNAVPVMIPVAENLKIIDSYLEFIDGILLSGGEDVNPQLYGETNTGLSCDVSSIRDKTEMYIIDKALKIGLPVLAICRGFQLLNVFFGGKLYQDIS